MAPAPKAKTDTIEVMLVTSAYTPNADHLVVDAGGANDPLDAEIVATNYTGGHAGAGRKVLASKTLTTDNTNDRAEFDAADIVWTALGGATNATVVGAIVIKRGTTNDTTARLIWYIDIADFTTNGSDVTVQWNVEGIAQLA